MEEFPSKGRQTNFDVRRYRGTGPSSDEGTPGPVDGVESDRRRNRVDRSWIVQTGTPVNEPNAVDTRSLRDFDLFGPIGCFRVSLGPRPVSLG